MSRNSDSIAALSAEISRFVQEREWEEFHDPKNLVMLLSSEVGELSAEFRWVASVDSDAHATGEARERVADELADSAIALIMLATRTRIDLAFAIRSKLAKNALKYPVELSRGRADRPRQNR